MNTKIIRLLVVIACGMFASLVDAQTPNGRLTIDIDKPGIKVSPTLYGIFFEEINRAGDGGIYAEMIQNRSFEDAAAPIAWKAQLARISLDKSNPLNENNPTNLRVDCSAGGGVSNGGYARDWHARNDPGKIAVEKGKKYDLSLFARSQNPLILTASVISANGKVLATQKIPNINTEWKSYQVTLTATDTDSYSRILISSDQAATFWLDMVSLFPKETWKGRKNGLRTDLMEKLEALKPAYVRFPGGCFVEGVGVENRVQWKKTIGDLASRPGHLNKNWGYYSTDGLGYHEYLQMCEDLGAQPLFVINCGIGHDAGKMYNVPMDQMDPFVQDALDAIEYANGPATSTWGALRAKAGHPEPFKLNMMEIGNENGGPEYDMRYALFHDAIKAKYPDMQLIANEKTKSRKNDLIDPHHYGDFTSFLSQINRYDRYDRKEPDVYFGEYAQTVDAGFGSLQAALGEAAFMTGLERNSDVVKMASYAPLLCHIDWRAWNPNAIVFDQHMAYGTPSYWVQYLFAHHRVDQIFPADLQVTPAQPPVVRGKIGVGTWGGSAEFKEIKVVKGDQLLFESDFSKGTEGWQTPRGSWTTQDGVLRQTGVENGTLAIAGDATWSDYTLLVKARKLSGPEGFLITFGARDEGEKSWWNVGGWGNKEHGVEATGYDAPHVGGIIEQDRWYDIKIELKGPKVNFYLDGELIHSIVRAPLPAFAVVAGRDDKTGEAVIKFVNASNESRTIAVELRGAGNAKLSGKSWVLTSPDPKDENSFFAPNFIKPAEQSINLTAPKFNYTFPENSVTILRFK